MLPITLRLPVRMHAQPDEVTCGPTCLQAIYRYWGQEQPLAQVIARARRLDHGGTLAVFLACDALRQGFEATIYTYNLTVFDSTWFRPGVDLVAKLKAQRREKRDAGLKHATEGYVEFMELGGRLRLTDLSRTLVRGLLRRRLPILTGLSSTFLYRSPREYGDDDRPDDIRGEPAGHFVVLAGYNRRKRSVLIVDPYEPHPYGPQRGYWINIDRVMGAILLGIVTHDANLLVISPRKRPARSGNGH
ncbi:MAG TPA: hypothetical protein VLT59_17170 [Steroidobacteraceae bacterium]|nr:hypothetical protein [Steroidobacteraceae bacterium]